MEPYGGARYLPMGGQFCRPTGGSPWYRPRFQPAGPKILRARLSFCNPWLFGMNIGDFMSKGMLLKIVEGHPKTALNAIRSPTNSSIYPERKVRMKKMTRKMKIYKLINAQFVCVNLKRMNM